MNCKRRHRAFTLIELLVVVSIIALLVSILMPALGRARETAKRTVCATNLKSFGQGLALYVDNYDGNLFQNMCYEPPYVPENNWMSNTLFYDAWMQDDNVTPEPQNLACLWADEIVTEPEMFYCPANRIEWARYEFNCNPAFGVLPQVEYQRAGWIQHIGSGYSYYPQSRKLESKTRGFKYPYIARKESELNYRLAIVTDLLYGLQYVPHQINGRNQAMNALFGDGHVVNVNDASYFTEEKWGVDAGKVIIRPQDREFRDLFYSLPN